MKTNKLPKISVVIATYNSEKTIDKCLRSIRNQDYPQEKVEIILTDGGSMDKTLSIAKKYNVKIIKVPASLQNAEFNKGQGVTESKGDFILMVDHDNILPHDKWLKKMLYPLIENKDIVGSETLRYHYDPKASFLDRYFALFGAGDPLAFYLGKADRLSYIYDEYNLAGDLKEFKEYYIVKFNKNRIPTLGANGFLIRSDILKKNADIRPNHFFHIDVNVDLIKKGYDKYAFIKDDIIHLTGYKSILSFLYRRKLFMEQFHFITKEERRYSVFEPRDRFKLIVFILYATTVIKPLYDSTRGFLKVKDIAWFFHPILSFVILVIYSYVVLKKLIIGNVKF